ncbi:MAG: ATP-binding protein [Acidobacteriota bacterium]|nr:ATP-binding protein [Acidobacteriota bacterium]
MSDSFSGDGFSSDGSSPRSRAELEAQLLRDPFDTPTRRRYAEVLETEGAWSESVGQWRILAQQQPTAEAYLRMARARLRLGEHQPAAEDLARARACDDFDEEHPLAVAVIHELEPPSASPSGSSASSEEGRSSSGEAPRRHLRAVASGPDRTDDGAVISIGATPKVRFSDVVGMEGLKKLLRLRIIEPFHRPGLFQRFKKKSGGGVLLYGPPGCGKTLMARAIATECGARFTAVGISDILSMWIGESERNLAGLFQGAREAAPAVLFFDELDALAYARGKASSDYTRKLVNEFLSQLDGFGGDNEKVLVLGATNMPWDVDEAMKRPGRFDRQIFIPPPDAAARAEMFRAKLRDVPCEPLDFDLLGQKSDNFSGADVDGAIDLAKDLALGDILDSGQERRLTQGDLLTALEELEPSTLEWLKTARNLVKFGGAGAAYKDVEKYLRARRLY